MSEKQTFELDAGAVERAVNYGVPMEKVNSLKDAADAIESAAAAWDCLSNASSPIDAAFAMTRLNDAMSDLVTWHPEYDSETHTLPFEREEV